MKQQFSIWAPLAKSMSLQVEGKVVPMLAGEHGWWTVDAEADHGTDYGFLIDQDPHGYPDPKSLWQPEGVHAASRVLDHGRFKWSDHGWQPAPLSKAIIYELHVGTFTPGGTFVSTIDKLADLKSLGVTHVELLPVNSFAGRWGWGYDGVSLYAPQEAYGGPDGLKQLVDACHAHGMALLMDVVYNHFGPVGNYAGKFGPYTTENHHTPWGGAVNLDDAGSTEVRRFFCDNALMWLRDYHIDGLRLDAVHAYVDRSAKHLLEQLAEEVEQLSSEVGKPLVLIAESDLNDPRIVTPRTDPSDSEVCGTGGYGIDAQWSDDFHHALFAKLTGEKRSYYSDFGTIEQIAKSLKDAYVFDGTYSEYRNRVHGRPVQELSAHRFLGYIQNHDQVGNRAFGDRIHTVAGMRKAKLAAAMVLMSPFVPMIFQGEEFAASAPFLFFADHEDPELSRAVSEGRRKEHASDGAWDQVPDPESSETFYKSKLDWDQLKEPEHREMLDWYRQLIKLRETDADLTDGDFSKVQVEFDEAQQWLSLVRGDIQCFFNFGDQDVSTGVVRESVVVLASDPVSLGNNGTLTLPATGTAILRAVPPGQ